MPAVAAMVSVNAANSANAAAAAAAAERYRHACRAWMPSFSHEGANTEQMRYYASCVFTLYPSDQALSPAQLMWFKTLVVFLIFGAVFGALRGYREKLLGPIGDTLMGGFVGSALGALAVGVCAGLWYGVEFVLS